MNKPTKVVELLYNLEHDPGEKRNIANKNMDLVKELQEFSMSHYKNMVPPKIGLQSFSKVRSFYWDNKSDMLCLCQTNSVWCC